MARQEIGNEWLEPVLTEHLRRVRAPKELWYRVQTPRARLSGGSTRQLAWALATTLAIVAGLIPTATGIGAGASQRSAIALTIIGGQSLCLLLSLLITPVAYSFFAELEARPIGVLWQAGVAKVRIGVARLFTLYSS